MIIHVHVCVHLGQVETQISKNINVINVSGGGGDFESPILVGHHFGLHLDHILTMEEVA